MSTGEGTPGAPKVTIRGFSLWGGVGDQAEEPQNSGLTVNAAAGGSRR